MKALQKFTDKILLDRSRAGDSGAFAVIFHRYAKKIYRFIFFRIKEKDLADDLTNEVFLRMWEQIRAEKKIDNLQAYLYKITRNLIIDHYRRQRAEVDIEKAKHLIDDEQDLLADVSLDSEVKDLLSKIEFLRDDYREILLLRYVEDFSIAEIAEILDKSAGAVKVMTHRAIKKLKEIYNSDTFEK